MISRSECSSSGKGGEIRVREREREFCCEREAKDGENVKREKEVREERERWWPGVYFWSFIHFVPYLVVDGEALL